MPTFIKLTFNSAEFKRGVTEVAGRTALPLAKEFADKEMRRRKKEFLTEFQSHPVSEELEAGAVPNYGINGVDGNLFSFFGFSDGSDPVGDLYSYFNRTINLSKNYKYNPKLKSYDFFISAPTIDEIKEATELSQYTDDGWGEGRSWAISIERGMPGLSHYKYSTEEKVLGGESRSGTALQRKKAIHKSAQYKSRAYITKLLEILQ